MSRWQIITGDALQVLPTIPAGSVDAVVTDPPYSSGGQFRGDRMQDTRRKYQSSDVQVEHAKFMGDNRDQRGWAYWCALWLGECLRVTKPGGILCMFTDWRQLPTATDVLQSGGWVYRGIVVWDKVVARPQPGRFRAQAEYVVWGTNGPRELSFDSDCYIDGVLRVTTTPPAEREHSTQKPVELLQEIVRVVPEGAVVLDPFAGSGTSLVAAVMSGRHGIGIELSPEYADIARRRCREAEESQALFVPPRREVQGSLIEP